MSQPVVTLDGPAGVGKTTIARNLAQTLCIPCLDTGAMFRTLALNLGEDGLKLLPDQMRQVLKHYDFRLEGCGRDTRLLCNDEWPGDALRAEKTAKLASALATRPEVRAYTLSMQQKIGSCGPLVTEGRDMGSVVFPDAAFKFFLDARPEVRALRRWRELSAKGLTASLEEITDSIRLRDAQDRNRPVAPLLPAPGATMVDTSDLDADQVLAILLAEIDARNGRAILAPARN